MWHDGAGASLPFLHLRETSRMPDHHPSRSARRDIVFAMGLAILLVFCWILGGVTEDGTPADEVLQLSALPLLGWAAWRASASTIDRPTRIALALALAVITLPAWQLLPLPHALGWMGHARHDIAADLVVAGVVPGPVHASLAPPATERALWSLLPALALFLGALTLQRPLLRRMLQLILLLVLASALFAFFQLSLPDDSPLLLYTSWGRNFGGLFVNPNHQGSALAIGAVIAFSLFLEGRRQGEAPRHRHWPYAFLAVACSLLLPLANGSAAMLLLLVGLLVVWLLQASTRHRRGGMLVVSVTTIVAGLVVSSALAWGQLDTQRRQIASETVRLGGEYAPLGAGVGNFVPVFAQSENAGAGGAELVNHAHDEYVQWWLEAGVPGLLAMAFGLAVFAWAGWCVWARMSSRRLRALAAPAWTGLLLLLLHSIVDFPLRTTTLMATGGLLAAMVLAGLAEQARRDASPRRHTDAAAQSA